MGQGAQWCWGGQGWGHQISDDDTIDRRHLTRDQKIQIGRKIEDDLAAIAAERQKALGRTHGTPLLGICPEGGAGGTKSAFHNPSSRGRWLKQINAQPNVRNA